MILTNDPLCKFKVTVKNVQSLSKSYLVMENDQKIQLDKVTRPDILKY